MMKNLFIPLVVLIALMSSSVRAQRQFQLPDSPTGRAVTALLTTIDVGNDSAITKFVTENLDPVFLEDFSMEDHLTLFRELHQNLGVFEVDKLNKTGEFKVEITLKATTNGNLTLFRVSVADRPPHLIDGLVIEPASAATAEPIEVPDYTDPNAVIAGSVGQRLDSMLTEKELYGYSGAVLVVRDGAKILHSGYGWANREKKIPNNTRTVFDVASYAKAFTMIAIMHLEFEGRLRTTDSIGGFFENVPDDKRGITIDHLIRMQSGLHEYHDRSGDFEPMDRAEAVKRIMEQPLRFEPGERKGYSNSGFALLAAIIETVSGSKYTEYVDSVFFRPAGLDRTGFYQDARWDDSSTACGYDARVFGEVNSPRYWPQITWACIGNGCLVSSPGDLGLWTEALWGDRVVSQAVRRNLYTRYYQPQETDWGGPMIATAEANDFGFTAASIEFPESHSYMFVCSNSGRANAPEIARMIAGLLFERTGE